MSNQRSLWLLMPHLCGDAFPLCTQRGLCYKLFCQHAGYLRTIFPSSCFPSCKACFLIISSSSFGILYSPSQVSAHEASGPATPSAILSLPAVYRLFKCFQLTFYLILTLCDPACNSFMLFFVSYHFSMYPAITILSFDDEYGGYKASLTGHFSLVFIIWQHSIFTPFLASYLNIYK